MLRAVLIAALMGAVGGCSDDFNDDYNLISGLRLIGAKAEPAEAAPGENVSFQAFAFDRDGSAIDVHWFACTKPPLPGTGTINDDCLSTDAGADDLQLLGDGIAMTGTLPIVDPESFGPPDFTGGIYLPIRMKLKSATETLDAILRLRLSQGAPVNHNPVLSEVDWNSGGTVTPLDETAPLPVHPGEQLTLRARFADGSAETYVAPAVGGGTRDAIETLDVSWFSTAGHFGNGSTGPDVDTVLDLGRNPPRAGDMVDLYAIGRDGRGGLDFLHRRLAVGN